MRMEKIDQVVKKLVNKFDTNDPFKIAKELNILIKIDDIGGCDGCYMYLKRHRCIFLNNKLSEKELVFVMAHELGHAILHRKINCYFLRNKTFLKTSVYENEANLFALFILISDKNIEEFKNMTVYQIADMFKVDEKIVRMRFKNHEQ